jgi:hypothetical protein
MAYISSNSSAEWPLYKTMIAENKRVVFISNVGGDTSETDFLMPQNQYLARTDYAVFSASSFSCAPIVGDSSTNPNALFQLNHMLSTQLSSDVCSLFLIL